jgi:hypothetical protein
MLIRTTVQWVLPFVLLLAGAAGCAGVLGLEEWKDPAGSGGAGGSDPDAGIASGPSASASGAGGMGGTGGTGGQTVNGLCSDKLSNAKETDIDCGGACPPCADTMKCLVHTDCQSGNCSNSGTCIPENEMGCESPDDLNPTCRDCAKNGLETDIDCGGDETCQLCRVGKTCAVDEDCLSSLCIVDQKRCAPGAPNAACHSGADCASGTCGLGDCAFGKCCL